MKQTKLWLTMIAALLCSFIASAHDFEADGIYYNITSYYTDLAVAVTSQGEYWDSYSNEYSGAVTIPSTVTYNDKTYSVTSIEACAFSYCSSLTSVTIPESVTSIEGLAFEGCSSLTSITIPESVTWIGDGVFHGCSSLTSVTILGSVTSIEDSAFYGCSSLNSITILGSVTSIGRWAFYGCSGLTSVTLPEGVTSIEGLAFEGCSNLSSINIPGSVTSIETRAFDGCSSLTFITVADGNTVYDSREGCNAIIETNSNTLIQGCSTTVIPESVTSIGSFAFYGCSGLASIAVPESVTSIGSYAFEGCSGLTSITIPEGVTSIEWHTFYDCSSLTSVTIPEGVTSIGRSAFSGCNSLTSITIPGSVTSIESGVFYGCSGLTSVTIPKGVTSIEDGVFSGCNSLSSITIPEGVTSIGNYAFEGCSGLTSVTIPKGVTSIEDGVFSGCNSLTSVTIPEGVTSIGSSAFSGCSGLASIVVPESVTSIGSYAFDGTAWYSNLPDGAVYAGKILYTYKGAMPENTSVEVKEGTVSIGGAAFRNCSGLTSIILPEGVTSIGSSAFYGCSGLTSIILPEGVTSIGYYAFEGCSSLTSVTIPESVTSIGEYAFEGCTGELIVNCNISPTSYPTPFYRSFHYSRFSKVTIGSKVTSIGDCAFEECTSLKEVVFEDGSETLSLGYNKYNKSNSFWPGEGLFYDCPLESVYLGRDLSYSSGKSYGYSPFYHRARIPEISLGNSITTIPPYLFYENESLPAITIPEGVTSIGRYAFYGCTGLTSITCMAEMPPAIDGSVTFYNVSKSIPVYVPVNFVADYQNAELWKEFSNIQPITYLLTYMLDGEVYKTQSIAYGSAVPIIPAPTKEGHTFSGWSEAPDTMPANDVVISGSFAVNKYLVTFKIGEEVIAADSLEYGATIIAPEAPEKEGHTFEDWENVPATMPANDLIIEGEYVVNEYLLTFVINGAVYEMRRVRFDEEIPALEIEEREGYTFTWENWRDVMPAKDYTIRGGYAPNSYAVIYVVDGVTVQADSIAYGTAITLPEAPTKEGHTFSGWSEAPETMPANDVTISGTFIINKYLVTFKIGDEVIATVSLEYGATIVAPEAPEKEGHTFNGWGEVAETVPAGDVTYEGSYTVNIYKVYYYVGEELVHTAEVAYGEAIPEYVYEPTGEGDVFEGWVGETYETMPAHDVTYTANIANGIEQLTIGNGQLTIYDLMGRKVTDTENLRGGIYIVNGKKVVIK